MKVFEIKNPVLMAREIRGKFTDDNFLDDIIEYYKIKLEPWPFSDYISGMLIISESYPVIIAVNKKHSRKRQRFTIAHETGHFLLGHGTSMCNSNLNGSVKENIANQFAAELLMPVKEIERMIQRELSKDLMAEAFDVSLEAMDVRLRSLKLDSLVEHFVSF